MFAQQQLDILAERRRLLVAEADLHRSLIGLESENLREGLARLQPAREGVTARRPWLVAGSAVVGLLAMRHWRKLMRWIPVALTAVRWAQSLKRF